MALVYTLITINTILTVLGQFVLKVGVTKIGDFSNYSIGDFILRIFTSPYILGGLTIFGFSVITWMALLSKVELSFAYPTLALGYVLVFIVSYFFLGETMNIHKILGLILIIGGIILVFRS